MKTREIYEQLESWRYERENLGKEVAQLQAAFRAAQAEENDDDFDWLAEMYRDTRVRLQEAEKRIEMLESHLELL